MEKWAGNLFCSSFKVIGYFSLTTWRVFPIISDFRRLFMLLSFSSEDPIIPLLSDNVMPTYLNKTGIELTQEWNAALVRFSLIVVWSSMVFKRELCFSESKSMDLCVYVHMCCKGKWGLEYESRKWKSERIITAYKKIIF